MTDLIATDVQGQEVDSAFITLFELDLPNGGKAFFHPGLDSSLENVHFRDATTPSQINEYIALPMDIDGLELQSDGALNRPTFSVANVTSVFEDQLGFTIHDIIGQRLTRRTTLQKYLDDGTGNSATPPVEFGKITYVIDRLAGENPTVVSFEVAEEDLEVNTVSGYTKGILCMGTEDALGEKTLSFIMQTLLLQQALLIFSLM
jgi:lambda family phage minor tail protein L